MSEHDLFGDEADALLEAERISADTTLTSDAYRSALSQIAERYRRMIRESRRMIRHSDRQERELTQLNERLRTLAAELEYKASHDTLTGVFNRGAIIARVSEQLKHSDIALIVLDIDHFKRVNDEFGHPVGDAVIVELVSRLRPLVDGRGDIGRVGGEEFTILLPALDLKRAALLGESLRSAVAKVAFAALSGAHVTASFGVSWALAGSTFDDAYAEADSMLYAAKREGRNLVRYRVD